MGNKCSTATEACGFQCTGYDGSHRWKEMHKIVDGIECETCRSHAVPSFSGYHDHVNAGLGEDVYDHENYMKFCDEVACVRHAYCKRSGKC